jgi:methyl-accepting chemotaxis protein
MEMLTEAAQARIESGEVQALGIRRQFMDAYQYGTVFPARCCFCANRPKALSRCLRLARGPDPPGQGALQANPDLLGLSLVFEPNGLDGKDELFAGQATWAATKRALCPVLVATDARPADLDGTARKRHGRHQHRPQRRSGQRLVHLPAHHPQALRDRALLLTIDGQNVLMTSIVFPLMVNGKLIASLSVDINLNSLQSHQPSASSSLYDGQTRSASSARRFARRLQRDASKLSQRLDRTPTNGAELVRMLAARQDRSLHSQQQKVLAPFQPIPGGKPGACCWTSGKSVGWPCRNAEKATGRKQHRRHPAGTRLGVLAALMGLLLVWLMARSVTRPILGVAHMLEDIASGEGDLTRRLAYDKRMNWANWPAGSTASSTSCNRSSPRSNARCRTQPQTSPPPSPPKPAPVWNSNTARWTRSPPLPTK